MKKVFSNKDVDVLEINNTKKDIIRVSIVKKATIKNKKTGETYFNSNFMLIMNRKGDTRVLDLKQGVDITSIFKKDFKLIYKDEELLYSITTSNK